MHLLLYKLCPECVLILRIRSCGSRWRYPVMFFSQSGKFIQRILFKICHAMHKCDKGQSSPCVLVLLESKQTMSAQITKCRLIFPDWSGTTTGCDTNVCAERHLFPLRSCRQKQE